MKLKNLIITILVIGLGAFFIFFFPISDDNQTVQSTDVEVLSTSGSVINSDEILVNYTIEKPIISDSENELFDLNFNEYYANFHDLGLMFCENEARDSALYEQLIFGDEFMPQIYSTHYDLVYNSSDFLSATYTVSYISNENETSQIIGTNFDKYNGGLILLSDIISNFDALIELYPTFLEIDQSDYISFVIAYDHIAVFDQYLPIIMQYEDISHLLTSEYQYLGA